MKSSFSPIIAETELYELLDSIYSSYEFEGPSVIKTKNSIFKERRARAGVYREIFERLNDPALFALFAYLSLADHALFFDFFCERLKEKVNQTASLLEWTENEALAQNDIYSIMYESCQQHELSPDEVKTPEFWSPFLPGKLLEMVNQYNYSGFQDEDTSATTEALNRLKLCMENFSDGKAQQTLNESWALLRYKRKSASGFAKYRGAAPKEMAQSTNAFQSKAASSSSLMVPPFPTERKNVASLSVESNMAEVIHLHFR